MSTFVYSRYAPISTLALVVLAVVPLAAVDLLLHPSVCPQVTSGPSVALSAAPVFSAGESSGAWNYVMLPNNMGLRWYDTGHYQQAIPYFELALKRYETVQLGPQGDGFIAAVNNNLAKSYVRVGRHREAVPLFEKALNLRARVYGLSDQITYGTVRELIPTYIMLGQIQKAGDLKKAVGEVHFNRPVNVSPATN